MGAAAGGGPAVDVAGDPLVVGVAPAEGHLHGPVHSGALALEADHIRARQGALVRDPVPGSAREAEPVGPGRSGVKVVGQGDVQVTVQEGQFLEVIGQCVERERQRLEDLGIGPEGDHGPTALGRAAAGGPRDPHAPLVLQRPAGSATPYLRRQAARQGVDNGHSHSGEPAAQRATVGARYSAPEHRQAVLQRGPVLVAREPDRPAPAVVGDADTAVDGEGDPDPTGGAVEDLVQCRLGGLEHQVVEPAFADRSDVHPGPFPDGLQALRNHDPAGVVRIRFLAHDVPSEVSDRAPPA